MNNKVACMVTIKIGLPLSLNQVISFHFAEFVWDVDYIYIYIYIIYIS